MPPPRTSAWATRPIRIIPRVRPLDAERFLDPGVAHPEPPLTVAEGAERFAVTEDVVRGWIDAGLPVVADGRLDPFLVGDWVADHRLAEAPILARRWRSFLAWFAPHVAGDQGPRALLVDRRHRLYLPPGISESVEWYLPRMADWGGQSVREDAIPGAQPTATHHRLRGDLLVRGTARVVLRPVVQAAPELLPLVEELVSGFTYTYRRHRPLEGGGDAWRNAGSCVDLTLALGERLAERGRAWRPVSGVIAASGLANPHVWLEVEGPGGAWIPVDPTLPCLARRFPDLMPAGSGDWRRWAAAWTGGLDARRVTLVRGEAPVARLPGGATGGSLIGEAVVDGRNAWNCLDWVCGSCAWTFSLDTDSG